MKKKLTLIATIFAMCSVSYGEGLKSGQKYKINKPVYLMAIYDDLNNKTLSKSTARAFLHSVEHYQKSFVAFQSQVPAGTIMTVVGSAPKPWYRLFFADQYYINLEPDLSQGLDVKLQMDRGFEGSLDGLNPEIFSRM